MLIKNHDKSRIVELEDGSLWRIWPGDLALTLNWLPTTGLRVSEISDEFCSHALIDRADGSRVRVIVFLRNREQLAEPPVGLVLDQPAVEWLSTTISHWLVAGLDRAADPAAKATDVVNA